MDVETLIETVNDAVHALERIADQLSSFREQFADLVEEQKKLRTEVRMIRESVKH